jgi:hypothetical protein
VRLDCRAKLFIGFKPEGKLRQAYDAANHGGYVGEAGDGKFLTTLEVDGQTYLGKVMEGGLSTDRVDDVTRNVLSILRRLVQGERLPGALAIFAVSE